ncbi:DNA recombination protein RmuC [Sphingobacterium sp. SGG-5]|uniref:DNA recombination protein RmuC n=1 Tax=Sphingobacterium sp. SGG-5 TaxID=2710881 RepID=UPI0013EBF86D|nr:DNA recombination protein RmuC [Sphingobacterium sp. SGG-5]NGM60695.1 DNA recombination protein RmuC [Sphingobacterium sp. SGG-5]
MEIFFPVIVVFLAVLCVYLFWRLGQGVSREKYTLLDEAKREIDLALARALQRGDMLQQDADYLTELLSKETAARQSVERTLESTNAYLQAQQEKFQEQKEELHRIRTQFNTEFQVLANKILEEKSQKFTDLNKQNIGLLLDPLKERIKHFEDKVEKTYHQEAAERHVLKGVVEQLMQQSMQIQTEAHNLTKALKGDNKRQGNWGEVILERVLERSGLIKDQEYSLQVSLLQDGGGRVQPDAIIHLPDNKHLVIDSKVSLIAYEKAVNHPDEAERALFLKQHVLSIERHIKELATKDYQSLYGIHSPDFVLLFMPIEPALSLAVTYKPELFSEAWERRVVIVSPSTLLATLRTVASIWKQERQNKNVLAIAREAGALYDKFVSFLQDMEQIQSHLFKASEKHQDAMKKLSSGQGNVIRKIESLKVLGAKATKQIDDKYLE